MNRVKSEIENFPNEVMHVCWLVDFWGRTHSELYGSDILYVWAHDWIQYFEEEGITNVFYLPPATDKSIYRPLNKVKKSSFVFLGHISKEWSQSELSRKIGTKDGRPFYFKEILPYIKRHVLSSYTTYPFLDTLKDENIFLDIPIDKSVLYDISSRSFRHFRRTMYIDLFANKNNKLVIYGSENWKLYKQYREFYKGYISEPLEINSAIQESEFLLHDGNYPHFRTFDAMAAGTIVASAQAPGNIDNPWNLLDFEDQKDYINIDIYSKNINIDIFLDKKLMEAIAQNAKNKVLAKHLWVHRVQKVIKDVQNLKKERNAK
jgi:hypothetical protein